jgi:hypothetical protein
VIFLGWRRGWTTTAGVVLLLLPIEKTVVVRECCRQPCQELCNHPCTAIVFRPSTLESLLVIRIASLCDFIGAMVRVWATTYKTRSSHICKRLDRRRDACNLQSQPVEEPRITSAVFFHRVSSHLPVYLCPSGTGSLRQTASCRIAEHGVVSSAGY